MSAQRTVKIQCFDERGVLSYSTANFPAHTLARFSRKGADEQSAKVRNPANIFEIHVDCSVDLFSMIINWMRANEKQEDVGRWTNIETPRHALTLRQKAKLYEVALYHFKVVRGAENIREGLVTTIDNMKEALSQADIEYLKKVLAQDSNLLFKIDKAVAKQFVIGLMHDDEVTKVQAWTKSRKEDAKMTHIVGEFITVLKNAGEGGKIRRDRWQDAFRNFPHINMGIPAAPPAPKIAAPPKNPWGKVAAVPVVKGLFAAGPPPSLSKDLSEGGKSTIAEDTIKPSPLELAPSSRPTASGPSSPKKSESPRPGHPFSAQVPLPKSNDITSEKAATEASGNTGSDGTISPQRHIQAWQAAQYQAIRFQTTPNRPMTPSEWRTFTNEKISIAKLEHIFAHGAIHQLDFDRVYDLYDDLIQAELWAAVSYVHPSSHVQIGRMYNHFYGGHAWYSHEVDDAMIFSAKRVVLDGFLRSVGGVGFPFGNLDFGMEMWGNVVLTMVDGMKMEQRAQVLTWRMRERVKSFSGFSSE
ncbi:hypothetical protein FKW77_004480 [Venturia effusa]|uniref:Uncharacterized protein n=1 Tax=Venturia effusa TaxID=50376 RepID=A0A517LNT8_9PEZI|nr:hypothetical protein FKW77_004480 [Venturia effusa]